MRADVDGQGHEYLQDPHLDVCRFRPEPGFKVSLLILRLGSGLFHRN